MTLDGFLHRADIALYAAKAAGRNACIAWQHEADPGRMRRVLKAGQIVFNSGRSVIDCTVRGLCDGAASLQVVSTDGIPQRFKLAIGTDDFSRICDITMKQQRRLEVTFA